MTYTWNNYNVLVAEDDPLNYRYIELLLTRRTGINPIWAKDGKEALRICRENSSIDIVLLDLQLPELDGIHTLMAIREFNMFLPVIIQTANSWNNEEENCYAAGCDGFFNKPLNMDELMEHMQACMQTYALNKELHINL